MDRIRTYELQLNTSLGAAAGYPLYAQLLAAAPAEFGEAVHRMGFTPVSQYVHGNRWHIALLGQEAVTALAPGIEQLERVHLRKWDRDFTVTECTVHTIEDPEMLLEAQLPGAFSLELLTPAAFKSSGSYQLLPAQKLIFGSLIQKWNSCFPELPIEDDGGGLDALAAGLVFTALQLQSQPYVMKGTAIPGTVGSLEARLQLVDFHRKLASALLTLGQETGVGIKTALGMGAFSIRKGNG